MQNREKSNSFEQQMAEQIIFEKVQDWLNKDLKENAKILVTDLRTMLIAAQKMTNDISS